MVRLPVLLELHEEKSIDLNSSFHEEGKTAINSVVVSGTIPILPGTVEKFASPTKPDLGNNIDIAVADKTSSDQGNEALKKFDSH